MGEIPKNGVRIMNPGFWIAITWGRIIIGTAIGYLILEYFDYKSLKQRRESEE